MMEIKWKIGKKPRGRWRTPVTFEMQIIQDEELSYRPKFVFEKEYPLPGKIYAGTSANMAGTKSCAEKESIQISIKNYFSEPVEAKSVRLLIGCTSTCRDCAPYLEWRPGKPDYSDFEKVFYQIATDILDVWNKAVEEARASEEYEGEEVVMTSDSLFKKKEEEKLAEKPSRMVKI